MMSSKGRIILILILMVAGLGGYFLFRGKQYEKGIEGVYKFEYSNAEETLKIHSSGLVEHSVRVDLGAGEIFQGYSEGHWNLHGKYRIDLWDVYVIYDGLGRMREDYQVPVSGLVSLPVGWDFFGTYIGTGEGVKYRKIRGAEQR